MLRHVAGEVFSESPLQQKPIKGPQVRPTAYANYFVCLCLLQGRPARLFYIAYSLSLCVELYYTFVWLGLENQSATIIVNLFLTKSVFTF
jgi:hypothetical protein